MKRTLAVAGILLWTGAGAARAAAQLQLPWSELGAHVAKGKVALVLPDGTHIEGKVFSVEPEGLRLDVTKTSDRKLHPKGPRLIPRQSVSFLRVIEYRHVARVVCALGAVAAAGLITAAGSRDLYEGSVLIIVPAVGAAGAAGLGVAGYYAGKRLDRKVTEIRIVP